MLTAAAERSKRGVFGSFALGERGLQVSRNFISPIEGNSPRRPRAFALIDFGFKTTKVNSGYRAQPLLVFFRVYGILHNYWRTPQFPDF